MAKIGGLAPSVRGDAVENGQIVPGFDMSTPSFRKNYIVLLFYPLDFTFVCPTELIAFSDRIEEFHQIGANVIGISMDSKFSHLAWTNTPRNKGGIAGLKFPLVSDFNKEISEAYGVVNAYGEDRGVPLRGMFILSPTRHERSHDRTIRQITINDLPIGRSVDETLRLIKALQYSDANPDQACPINWTPGQKAIKTNTAEAASFFESQYGDAQ